MWWTTLFNLVKGAFSALVGKLPLSTLLWFGAAAVVGIGYVNLTSSIASLKTDNADITSKIKEVLEQNEDIRKINLENNEAYLAVIEDYKQRQVLNEQLRTQIENIKNVEHTKEIIIQEAKGACLDHPYPDSIFNTFLWPKE